MKTWTSLTAAALILVGTLGIPQKARAGDHEWSTAGKILTGLVAFQVLGGIIKHEQGIHRRTAVSQSRSIYNSTPRRTPRHCRPAIDWRPAPRSVHQRPCPRTRTIIVEKTCRPVVRHRSKPIIVKLEDGRRLYQPRVHGHKAFLQVFSEVSGEWVSIREYPSIW